MILYQVNRVLFKQNIIRQFFRFAHNEHSAKVLYPLESRSFVKVKGNDAAAYLQGLITNDMQHFEEGANSMYTMFLNNKGRVLYDALIHKWEENESFMVECDKSILSLLQKHLKLYKLKRKIDIEDVSTQFKLWALITHPDIALDSKIDTQNNINIYKDPRLADLGYRVICTENVKHTDLHNVVGKDATIENSEVGYKYLRYKLGVSEGAEDLPPGTSFPLEANCDYLHGVSFHKGCYIGQEVTARVHHTGVVRKRIMPLKFKEKVAHNLEKDTVISDSDKPKSNLGKLKSSVNDCGLGLVRIKEALEAKALMIGQHSVELFKPAWWPIEAPKEKPLLSKLE